MGEIRKDQIYSRSRACGVSGAEWTPHEVVKFCALSVGPIKGNCVDWTGRWTETST